MPDLLIELFSEEIPSRFQRKAAGDLRKLVTDQLVDAGLTYEGAREYWTPRRLALDVRGLTPTSADIREEKKGPRTDAPEQAVAGFLRGAGLTSIDQAEVRSDPKKGDFYVAVIEKPGRTAEAIIADVMPGIIRNFPWPKSMRWGEASREAGAMRWVRPLHSIICTFGPETEDPEVVEFEVSGIKSGNTTQGHRFLSPGQITVKRFDDYVAKLEKAKVVLDPERRKEIILADAQNLCFAQGFELVEDAGLLEEVAGLVEWPTVLMGEFDEAFLDIPPEVIQLTIRENQKCFVVRKQQTDASGENPLTNRFMLVSNIVPSDGGKEVMRGNGKVVNARLSDAKFFWDNDLQQVNSGAGFAPWNEKLDNVTFHAKLGTQGERVSRIIALAEELAPIVAKSQDGKLPAVEEAAGTDVSPTRSGGEVVRVSENELVKLAKRAAELCKADLQSAMVFEFPEVQGLMGKYYAEAAGEDLSVASAIKEYYQPLGPSDDVPSDPVSVTVALADKLDTLVGFWAIDEKPTGSKDPYALRRAALGVIRLVLENGIRLPLTDKMKGDLLSFFHDRLKVYLRDQGIRHDLIDAVLTSATEVAEKATVPDGAPSRSSGKATRVSEINDDLLIISQKANALQKLIETDDGVNLVAGYKRAANILAAEEKKGTEIAASVDEALFRTDEERALYETLGDVEMLAGQAVASENFEMAMSRLATLRAPIDNFFEHVLVNDDDGAVRANRLALLTRIRTATGTVADFSKISG